MTLNKTFSLTQYYTLSNLYEAKAEYFENIAKDSLKVLHDLGLVYKGKDGEYYWIDTNERVGGDL